MSVVVAVMNKIGALSRVALCYYTFFKLIDTKNMSITRYRYGSGWEWSTEGLGIIRGFHTQRCLGTRGGGKRVAVL